MTHDAIQHLPLEQISVAPQVREEFDEASLNGLALSLKQVGQLQPIGVRRDGERLVLVYGERRLRAAKLAGLKTIKASIEERQLSSDEATQQQLAENCHRKQLTPMERARGIKKFMAERGCTASEAAVRLDFSPPAVSRHLNLLSLQSEVSQKVESGAIPASTAYELTKVTDPAKQIELAQKIVDGKLTREQATKLVREATAPAPPVTDRAPIRLRFELGGGRWVIVCCTGFDDSILSLKEALAKLQREQRRNIEIGELKKVLRREARTVSSAR